VVSERQRTRCREQLERLSESRLHGESIQLEAIAHLQRVVGFDRWCSVFADPHTLVPLRGIAEHDYGPGLPRVLELEYSGDFAAMDAVARRTDPVGSLSADTGGDLPCSSRWDQVLRGVGIGDEAVVGCRDAFGCWGWIKAYRDSSDRPFGEADLEFLASVVPALALVMRRGTAEPIGQRAHAPLPPGVIVLNSDLAPVSQTAGVQAWINALPGATLFEQWGMLPVEVYPLATLARSGKMPAEVHALERALDGRWVIIEAARLEGNDDGNIAVTFRTAELAETFDLLCRAYALTQRERDVVAAVLAGFDTRGITERLFISRHTVQDHLKSVFEKTGVHSRRALLGTFGISRGTQAAE
jgi:DNA-binding CsgD family transcriptional regulator